MSRSDAIKQLAKLLCAPQPPAHRPTPSTAANTSLYDAGLEEDLAHNAKAYLHPTNAMPSRVVGSHQRIVLASIAKKDSPLRQQHDPELLKFTSSSWAATTVDKKRAIWERFATYRRETGPADTLDLAAAKFIANIQGISLGTRKTYAVSLAGLLREMVIPCPTLSMARRGMVALGANVPETKATPLRRAEVVTLVNTYRDTDPALSFVFWLMWKTASRFSDAAELTRENFKVVDPQELVLIFGKFKTNRSGVILPASLCHIKEKKPMHWQVNWLSRMPPEEKIVPYTYSTFLSKLQKVIPHASAHSFKHGAHDHLLQEAEKGQLNPSRIPLLMKHSDPSTHYPEQTVAYASEGALILYARQFGSGEATLLL